MTALDSCPFCGSEAVMETFTTAAEKVPRYRVRCTGEKCPIDSGWDWFDPEELAKWWNTRSVPKKGEWVKKRTTDPVEFWRCSVCGGRAMYAFNRETRSFFCPSCGARMEGGNDAGT